MHTWKVNVRDGTAYLLAASQLYVGASAAEQANQGAEMASAAALAR